VIHLKEGLLNVHTNNVITATGVAAGTWTSIIAQASPGDRLSILGALMALLVLAVRTLNELGKGWLAYKEAQLHEGELRAKIAELQAEQEKMRRLAAHGVCPLSEDSSPACGRTFVPETKP
jgi:hypothetical protein